MEKMHAFKDPNTFPFGIIIETYRTAKIGERFSKGKADGDSREEGGRYLLTFRYLAVAASLLSKKWAGIPRYERGRLLLSSRAPLAFYAAAVAGEEDGGFFRRE